jgi:hypothetical protein
LVRIILPDHSIFKKGLSGKNSRWRANMKNSVELLVILMIFWAVFVVLYNFIGQAFAISGGRNSLKGCEF